MAKNEGAKSAYIVSLNNAGHITRDLPFSKPKIMIIYLLFYSKRPIQYRQDATWLDLGLALFMQ